jgi:hypothetical protein
MRIQEINEVTKDQLRKLSKRPEVDSNYDEESPEMDDIRKRRRYSDSKNKGKTSVGYTDITDKDLHGVHPVQSGYKGITGEFKEFAEEFFERSRLKGYTPEIIVDGYGYSLDIRTQNGVTVSIAGNSGNKLPSKFRPFIRQTKDENLQNKKEELYSTLRELYNLPDTAFTKNGKEFFMDGGKPSLPMTGSKDQRLDNFFKSLPYIENMGNVAIANRGSSASAKFLVSRVSTPVRYYLGAASLIYIATRFGLPHLVPRGGGDSESTFDIKRDFISVGITEEGYKDYEDGREPYYEHAVPCNVIQKAAIEMVKENKSQKLVDEELIMKIANMIKRNLLIVRTGHKQSADMDKIHRQTMPSDWDPLTGDPLQRFVDLGIKVYPIGGGKRLRESNRLY